MGIPGGTAFKGEETASSKALRWDEAGHIQGTWSRTQGIKREVKDDRFGVGKGSHTEPWGSL